LSEWLGLVIRKLVIAEIFDDRMELDLEPLAEQGKSALLRPRGFIGVPTEELALEDFSEYTLENLLRLVVVIELWNKIDGLLAFHIGYKAGIIELCCPVEEWLLGAHNQDGSVQHDRVLYEA